MKLIFGICHTKHHRVAPYAGAWIEILVGLDIPDAIVVAPYAGAWIEIVYFFSDITSCDVAPYAGAWIEISVAHNPATTKHRRSLRGSVD